MAELLAASRVKLRQGLVEHFSVEDLELLCDDLGVDPETVPGRERGKESWAGEVVRYFERRDRIAELVAALRQRRPAVHWDDAPQTDAGPAAAAPADEQGNGAWWDHLPAQAPQTGGDVIIATIGAGVSGVAVGKHISQNVQTRLGPATPSDQELIEQAWQPLMAALAGAALDAATRSMAGFQLNLLKSELLKTAGAELPSASTITQVGGWLLQQAPALRTALANLFVLPAAGRVLARAGDSAVTWAQQAFGARTSDHK